MTNYRRMTCPECGEPLHVGWIGPGITDAKDPGVFCSSRECRWSNTLNISRAAFKRTVPI